MRDLPAASMSVDPRAPRGRGASWRKRHPVLARVLLYGLGLALAGTGLWLWLERRSQDEGDHVSYLWARLESLPVVIQTDPTGSEVQRALDGEFPAGSVPGALGARAERLRGIVARFKKDPSGMDAAFARARNLDVSQASVDALTLEWVACRIDLGDLVGARQLLLAAPPSDVTLGLWRHLLAAQLEAAAGNDAGARAGLLSLLDHLPKPLPRVEPTWFMLNAWTVRDVLIEAVRWLVTGLPEKSPAAVPLWKRLRELCPGHPRALWEAAEGLLAAQDPEAARGAWRELESVDPQAALKAAERNPQLKTLSARPP